MNEILKIFVLVRIFQENFGILGISGILRGTSTLFIFQQFSCLKKLSFYFLISFLSNSGKMGLNFSGKFLGKNLTSNSSQIFFQQLDCTRCGKTWVTVKYVKYILFLSCTTLYYITQSFSKQMSRKVRISEKTLIVHIFYVVYFHRSKCSWRLLRLILKLQFLLDEKQV